MNDQVLERLKTFKETHLATNPRHVVYGLAPEQCWECFLISHLEEAMPAAAKWWQVYQDRCEGAYMEVTLHKERVKELREAISHRNERIVELQHEVSVLRERRQRSVSGNGENMDKPKTETVDIGLLSKKATTMT